MNSPVRAILELHGEVAMGDGAFCCRHCTELTNWDRLVPWPCETAKLILAHHPDDVS